MRTPSAGSDPQPSSTMPPRTLPPHAAEHLRSAVQLADRLLRTRNAADAARTLVRLLGHLRALRDVVS